MLGYQVHILFNSLRLSENAHKSLDWSWKDEGEFVYHGYSLREILHKFFNPKTMSVQEWHIALVHPSITAMQHM